MGKKNTEENNKQDKRLKPNEATLFKSSKSAPKASTDLVIALTKPETKNMDVLHVNRAMKARKDRTNSKAALRISKFRDVSPVEDDSGAISGDDQPLSGDGNIEKEIPNQRFSADGQSETDVGEKIATPDYGKKIMGEKEVIAEILPVNSSPNQRRKSQSNHSPATRKVNVQIKVNSLKKIKPAAISSNKKDSSPNTSGNVTIRKKSAEGLEDYDSGNDEADMEFLGIKEKEADLIGKESMQENKNDFDTPNRRIKSRTPNMQGKKKSTKQAAVNPEKSMETTPTLSTEINGNFTFPASSNADATNQKQQGRHGNATLGTAPETKIQENQSKKIPSFNLVESPVARSEGTIFDAPLNANQNKQLWKSMFSGNRNALADYKLNTDSSYKEVEIVELTVHDADVLTEHWGYALLAYVAGKSTGKKAIDDCCKNWGVPYALHFHTSGWIIIKFNTEEDRDKVLLQGPYYIFGKLLMLKELPKFFDFSDYEINHIPIWVHISKLPLDFWNVRSLSKLGGYLGKPIQTDKITFTRGRVSFVRILVEMDLSKNLPQVIPIKLPNGRLIEARVEYEFIPRICVECKGIGHSEDRCFLLHPELKPKIAPNNVQTKQREQNTSRRGKNIGDHVSNYQEKTQKSVATTSEGGPPIRENIMFHNSFSQLIDQNQLKTSSKKGFNAVYSSNLDATVSTKQDKQFWKQSLAPDEQIVNTKVINSEAPTSSMQIISPTQRDNNTGKNKDGHVQHLQSGNKNCVSPTSSNPGRYSDSSSEDGEFRTPKKKHSTRNKSWTKAVVLPDISEGRGPTPSSPR